MIKTLPFRHKLTLVLVLTSGLALLLACAAFIGYDVVAYRAQMVRDLGTLARIIGDNSTAALAFNDPRDAQEILGALRARADIESAVLYAPGGRRFAAYHRDAAGAAAPLPPAAPEGHRFGGRRLVLVHTILLDGVPAGVVALRSDLGQMYARLGRYGAAVGTVLVVCMLAALLVSARLQRVVSRPILELAATARTVSLHKDFSVRADQRGHDEVAILARAFNEMLAQIQAGDAALRRAHEELEARVEERTRQLRREITERQQAQEALRASEEQLQQSQKMEAVGRLAGGIAHDFNNLLTGITGYSQLLLVKMAAEHPLRRNAVEIRKAADRAAALTRQLLAFSRKQLLEPKVLDLNSLVANMDGMLRPLIGEDIELTTALEPALGRVQADPGQVEQVILNLTVNARDAMPAGGRIAIHTANLAVARGDSWSAGGAEPGAWVLLTVKDTGHGMDDDTKSRIFEPFFTTKEKGKGTGLGLSMVYGIVRQSGGHIVVDSAPGRGATFSILLPRVEAEVDAPAARPAAEAASRGPEARARETLLLVEDEAMVRALTREVLRERGYTVLEAAHGGEALALCGGHAGAIDLMLTDVVMPGMNGHELYRRLAGLRPGLRVLYMSGYAEDGIVHDGAIDPGTAFLAKPFTPEALAAKVREVLDEAGSTAAPERRRTGERRG